MPPTDIPPLSRRLADLIAADGRSATDIARAAGVSDQYLSDLRAGRRGGQIAAALLVPLLRALGVRPTDAGRLLYECYPEKIRG